MTLVIRCSSLDRVLACAGSLEETAAPFAPLNPEATEGKAAHEAMAAIVVGLVPDIDAIAARYGVDANDLAALVRKGIRVWEEVQQWFSGVHNADSKQFEAALSPEVMLRGTPDLLSAAEVMVSVLDHKFGWEPSEHPAQLRGYAYLAREAYGMPASGYITGIESWARPGVYRVHKFTDADLDRLRAEVLEQTRHVAKQFGPSRDACLYCPRQNDCSARADWLRSAIAPLVQIGSNLPITPEMLAGAFERAREFRRFLDQYDAALGQALDLRGGTIKLTDGRELRWEEDEQDEITPSLALDYLRDELKLTPAEIDRVLGVTKGGLKDVLKKRAPYRQGAAMFRAAMARLSGLGAVATVIKRKKKIA